MERAHALVFFRAFLPGMMRSRVLLFFFFFLSVPAVWWKETRIFQFRVFFGWFFVNFGYCIFSGYKWSLFFVLPGNVFAYGLGGRFDRPTPVVSRVPFWAGSSAWEQVSFRTTRVARKEREGFCVSSKRLRVYRWRENESCTLTSVLSMSKGKKKIDFASKRVRVWMNVFLLFPRLFVRLFCFVL